MVLIENDFFRINANEKYVPYIAMVLNNLTKSSKMIRQTLRKVYFPQVEVFLFDNEDEYKTYASNAIKDREGAYQDRKIFMYCQPEEIDGNKKFISEVLHEYTHMIYRSIYEGEFTPPAWLDEGIAEYFSGEKKALANDYDRFKSYFLRTILNRKYKVPHIEYLQEYGTSKHKLQDRTYNGEAISYLLVRYLISQGNDMYSILSSEKNIKEKEKKLVSLMVNYYGAFFQLKTSIVNIRDVINTYELMDYMDVNFNYGWVDKFGFKHENELDNFKALYRISTPEQIMNTGLACCIEQAMFEFNAFQNMGINAKIFVDHQVEEYDEKKTLSMHCFVAYESNDKWYWFEHSNFRKRGIRKYDNLELLLDDYQLSMKDGNVITEIPYIPCGISYGEFNQFINQFGAVRVKNEGVSLK